MKKSVIYIILLYLFSTGLNVGLSFSLISTHQTLTVDQIKTEIEDYIRSRLSPEVVKLTVEANDLPESLLLPAGKSRIEIQLLSNKEIKGSVLLQLAIMVDQSCIKKITTTIYVRRFENILIAQRNLSRHENLTAEDVTLSCVETTGLNGVVFHAKEQIQSYRMKRFVAVGHVITSERIEPIPLVNRGDIVTMIVTIDCVSVTTLGRALSDGCVHDIIDVKNLDSDKRIKCEIIDHKRVLVKN